MSVGIIANPIGKSLIVSLHATRRYDIAGCISAFNTIDLVGGVDDVDDLGDDVDDRREAMR